MSRPRFKTRRTEDPSQDPHCQDVKSPTSWQHLRPVPYKRYPPEKSPPRTTSLCLARQVSASHDLPPGSDWCVGHNTRREPGVRAPPPKRVGERFPAPCKHTSLRSCKQLAPTRAVRLHDHPINIISHSATRKLSPKHSSTLYDALEPRLRPKRGGLVK
jgi:hypothetical protein